MDDLFSMILTVAIRVSEVHLSGQEHTGSPAPGLSPASQTTNFCSGANGLHPWVHFLILG